MISPHSFSLCSICTGSFLVCSRYRMYLKASTMRHVSIPACWWLIHGLYNRDFKSFNRKIKLPPVGIEFTADHHWFTSQILILTVLICHVLPVSYFQILIKSCSIEYRNDSSPKVKWCMRQNSV